MSPLSPPGSSPKPPGALTRAAFSSTGAHRPPALRAIEGGAARFPKAQALVEAEQRAKADWEREQAEARELEEAERRSKEAARGRLAIARAAPSESLLEQSRFEHLWRGRDRDVDADSNPNEAGFGEGTAQRVGAGSLPQGQGQGQGQGANLPYDMARGKRGRKSPPFIHEPTLASTTVFSAMGAPALLLESHAGLEHQTVGELVEAMRQRLRMTTAPVGLLVTQSVVMAVLERCPVLRFEGLTRDFTFVHSGFCCLGATSALWRMNAIGHALLPEGGLLGFHEQALRFLNALQSKGRSATTNRTLEAGLVTAWLRRNQVIVGRNNKLLAHHHRGDLLALEDASVVTPEAQALALTAPARSTEGQATLPRQ